MMTDEDRQRQKLQSLQIALDEQDALLIEATKTDPNYEIPIPQLVAIKGVFKTISSNFPDLISNFSFYGQSGAVRSQIRAARLQIQLRMDALSGVTAIPHQDSARGREDVIDSLSAHNGSKSGFVSVIGIIIDQLNLAALIAKLSRGYWQDFQSRMEPWISL
jgi:hypothetical protein